MTILLRSRIYSVHLPDEILRDLICYPEEPHALLFGVGLLVLGLERFIVDLGAGPQFVLCICEETMRAVARDKKKSSGFEQREYVLRFEQSEMPLLNKARVNNCVFIRHRRPGTRS